jgi:hypothetical protein
MSVDSTYFSVDWNHLPELPCGEELASALFGGVEAGAPWVRPVPFGKQVPPPIFESWMALVTFSDWFHEQKRGMNRQFVRAFTSVFKDAGLLFGEDDSAPHAIKINKELDPSGEWLIAAIPPASVAELLAKAEALELQEAEREFHRALEEESCEVLPNGAAMVAWIEALREGLAATSAGGHGIIAGAA